MNPGNMDERGNAQAATAAAATRAAQLEEHLAAPRFTFGFRCVGPIESERSRYVALRDRLLEPRPRWWQVFARLSDSFERDLAAAALALIPMETKWADAAVNTVLDAGARDLLDKYFGGSGYTAAFYMGLVASTGYSAIAAADTAASHAGWGEAGGGTAPAYSNATRPAVSFSAASGRSKATSAAVNYSFTSGGTVKGAFVTTNNTKDGTSGTHYSAGLFTGGDKTVANGDSLAVTGSFSV